MDDDHQRSLGKLALRGDVHVHRQNLLELGALPAAGAEGVLPAHHDQPAAEVVDVAGQRLVVALVQPAGPGDVVQNDGVVVLEQDQFLGDLVHAHALDVDALGLEGTHEGLAGAVACVVDVEHAALALDEGEGAPAVVLKKRVAGQGLLGPSRLRAARAGIDDIGLEGGLEAAHAAPAQRRDVEALHVLVRLDLAVGGQPAGRNG